jgi:chorismate synthase
MTASARLDGAIAQALMSVPAIKGVEIGSGFRAAELPGSKVHDEIFYSPDAPDTLEGHGHAGGFYHRTNNAGGVEGGISNGEPIVARAAMKPIPTLSKPLRSVDFKSRETFEAAKERSDACAVPAAAVVGQAAMAYVVLKAFLEKFGGDSLEELKRNYKSYLESLDKP